MLSGIIKCNKTNLSLGGGDPGEEDGGVGPDLLVLGELPAVLVVEDKVVVGLGALREVRLHERQLGALLEREIRETVNNPIGKNNLFIKVTS